MTVKITKRLVSADIISRRSYGKGNPVTSITVHQTGNRAKGANAESHARLQARLNPRQASWHYQVDDKQVVQSFEDNIRCWAATDGRGPGNTTSIHIEICINADGDYKKAVENAVELVKIKLKEHNLKITDVKRHFDWINKFCPEQLMRGHQGITWDDFLNMVEDVSVAPRPAKPLNDVLFRVRKSWNDPKSQKGAYKSLSNAQSMAKRHKGYNVYDSSGKVVYGSEPTKTINQMAVEVIKGQHGTGHANRRKSLAISQSEYEKVRTEVNKLAGGNKTYPTKTIAQLASEVINGEHGNGHVNRRKSLGISQNRYDEVRVEVNRRT